MLLPAWRYCRPPYLTPVGREFCIKNTTGLELELSVWKCVTLVKYSWIPCDAIPSGIISSKLRPTSCLLAVYRRPDTAGRPVPVWVMPNTLCVDTLRGKSTQWKSVPPVHVPT
ncbi:uncharacterized protein LOC144440356 isoform X1 [Glandiceps talaboti]